MSEQQTPGNKALSDTHQDSEQPPVAEASLTEPSFDEPEIAESHQSSQTASASSATGGIAILLALIALVLVVAGAWFGYQKLEQYQRQLAAVELKAINSDSLATNYQQQIGQLQQQLQSLAEQQSAAQVAMQSHQHQLVVNRLQQLEQQVASQSNSMVNDAEYKALKVAELKHLVVLANDSLVVANNVAHSLSVLELSLARIEAANIPELNNLKRAIIEDITSLKLLTPVDKGELIVRLMTLQKSIEQLPLASITATESEQSSTIDSMPKDLTWHENLKQAFGELANKWFEIRHHEQAVVPMLTLEQQVQLISNIRLLMHNAQLAVIYNDQQMYLTALEHTEAWVKRLFAQDAEAVKNYLAALTDVAQAPIGYQLPAALKSFEVATQLAATQLGGQQ